VYARVTAMLGNNRVRAKFDDNQERLCRIRGSMRRREWVHVGDIVLVCMRDGMADDTGDIVFRYQPAEVQRLRKLGEPVTIAGDDEDLPDDIVAFEAEPDDYEPVRVVPRRPAMPESDESDVDLDEI
jgi:translation initiation factor IF-1